MPSGSTAKANVGYPSPPRTRVTLGPRDPAITFRHQSPHRSIASAACGDQRDGFAQVRMNTRPGQSGCPRAPTSGKVSERQRDRRPCAITVRMPRSRMSGAVRRTTVNRQLRVRCRSPIVGEGHDRDPGRSPAAGAAALRGRPRGRHLLALEVGRLDDTPDVDHRHQRADHDDDREQRYRAGRLEFEASR